jgi:pyridoxine 4-dehydrogenase
MRGEGWPACLLIPGTSSLEHLRENLASAEQKLPDEMLTALNRIGDVASPSA